MQAASVEALSAQDTFIDLLGKTLSMIEQHRASRTYTITSSVKKTVVCLQQFNMCIITGRSGVGKTTTAVEVLSCLLNDQNPWIPVQLEKSDTWDVVVTSNKPVAVFLDDPFGKSHVDVQMINAWLSKLKAVHSVLKTGRIRVVMTSRNNILDEVCKIYDENNLFSSEFIIDLSSSQHALSEQEKIKMVNKFEEVHQYIAAHLNGKCFLRYVKEHGQACAYKLSSVEKSKIVNSNPYLGFPQTCFLFFTRKEYFEQGFRFFAHANEKVFDIIENLRSSSDRPIKVGYCLLVYTFVNNGYNPKTVREYQLAQIYSKVEVNDVNAIDRESAIKKMLGLYLNYQRVIENEHVLCFSHEAVREAVCLSYSNFSPDTVIKHCGIDFINTFVKTENYEKRPGEVVIKIPVPHYGALIERLCDVRNSDQNLVSFDKDERVIDRLIYHSATNDLTFIFVLFDSFINQMDQQVFKMFFNRLVCARNIDISVLMSEMLRRFGPHVNCDKKNVPEELRRLKIVDGDEPPGIKKGVRTTETYATEVDVQFSNSVRTTDDNKCTKQEEKQQTNKCEKGDDNYILDVLTTGDEKQHADLCMVKQCNDTVDMCVQNDKMKHSCKCQTVGANEEKTQQRKCLVITRNQVRYALFESIRRCKVSYADLLINYIVTHCDVRYHLNTFAYHGFTPLHYFVAQGWYDQVETILSVHTPTKSRNNWSCAHIAAFCGRFSLLQKFVSEGMSLTEVTKESYTPLHTAMLGLRYKSREAYFSVDVEEETYFWMVCYMAEEGQYRDIIHYLLTQNPTAVNELYLSLDKYHNNIIHYLILHDRKSIFKMLFQTENLVQHRNDSELPTTLHTAVYLGRYEMVRTLMLAGIQLKIEDMSLIDALRLGKVYSGQNLKCVNYGDDEKWENEDYDYVTNVKLLVIDYTKVHFGSECDYELIEGFLKDDHS